MESETFLVANDFQKAMETICVHIHSLTPPEPREIILIHFSFSHFLPITAVVKFNLFTISFFYPISFLSLIRNTGGNVSKIVVCVCGRLWYLRFPKPQTHTKLTSITIGACSYSIGNIRGKINTQSVVRLWRLQSSRNNNKKKKKRNVTTVAGLHSKLYPVIEKYWGGK